MILRILDKDGMISLFLTFGSRLFFIDTTSGSRLFFIDTTFGSRLFFIDDTFDLLH
jgi:hypothetical protein